jgi:Tfp pilus assembly protein PilN
MRPINLLPARYQPARASGERPGIGYAAIGALAVLLLMVVLYVTTNNGINDAKDKTAKAQVEQQAAQAKIGQLQAYGDFASLKQAREQAVKNAAAVRFDYERLMREMALVLPHNTYLTSFAAGAGGPAGAPASTTTSGSTTATGPTLAVTGCAPSHPGVATAIVRLRKLHNVVDVNLNDSTKSAASNPSAGPAAGAAAGPCPVKWTATLTFQPESAPTVQGPVPARLGGGQ